MPVEIGGECANQQESLNALLSILRLPSASVVTVRVVPFASFIAPLVAVRGRDLRLTPADAPTAAGESAGGVPAVAAVAAVAAA